MQHPSVVQDCFNHVLRLKIHQASDDSAAFAEAVHAVLVQTLGSLMRQPQAFGVSAADAQEIAFAIAALADESALAHSAAIALRWQDDLLQTRLFGENRAGEQFFSRLEQLLPHRATRHAAILAYHTALGLGFVGRFANQRGSSASLMRLRQQTRDALLEAGALIERQLAPEAVMPLIAKNQGAQRLLRRFHGALGFGAAFLAAAVFLGAATFEGRAQGLVERAELALARLGAQPGSSK